MHGEREKEGSPDYITFYGRWVVEGGCQDLVTCVIASHQAASLAPPACLSKESETSPKTRSEKIKNWSYPGVSLSSTVSTTHTQDYVQLQDEHGVLLKVSKVDQISN